MALSNTTYPTYWTTCSCPMEAYGVHGMQSKPWHKRFKSQYAFEQWLEKNEGDYEVQGTRDIE